MKNVSPGMLALLASGQYAEADFYTFSLIGGSTLRYTSGPLDIVFGGNTYSAGGQTGPFMPGTTQRPLMHQKVGLEAQTISFDIIPGDAMIGSMYFVEAVKNGIFDGAGVMIQRVPMPTYGDTTNGVITIFDGRMTEVNPAGRTMCTFNASSWVELLNIQMPRNLYQSGCLNTLGDTACTINQTLFSENGTATGASTASVIASTLTGATGIYNYGKIAFTGGACAGQVRGIRNYVQGTPGTIALLQPFTAIPANGDAFSIYQGCDKQQATCNDKFNNLMNFRGMPYVPQNTTAV